MLRGNSELGDDPKRRRGYRLGTKENVGQAKEAGKERREGRERNEW